MSKRGLEAEDTRMAKVQRTGEQHPPVLFIDDVISEMLELNGLVAPVKNDAFRNIVNKLLGTEILVQKKQAGAELPFVYIEDVITDLIANIDLYVGQDGKYIFEKILEKMQSNKLPLPVLYIEDLVSQMLELDGYVAIEKNGAFQNILNKLKGTTNLVQKKQADADLLYVFVKEVISEMRANIDRYVGQVGKNLFEKVFETMKSKRLVRMRNENQNSNREEVIVEVERPRFVYIDPPKEERLDNYAEVVMNSGVDGKQNSSPYAKQEQAEVDEQPNVPESVEQPVGAAMELNGSISEVNPEQIDCVESHGSDGENNEGDAESSEDPPQRMQTRRSSAILIPVKQKVRKPAVIRSEDIVNQNVQLILNRAHNLEVGQTLPLPISPPKKAKPAKQRKNELASLLPTAVLKPTRPYVVPKRAITFTKRTPEEEHHGIHHWDGALDIEDQQYIFDALDELQPKGGPLPSWGRHIEFFPVGHEPEPKLLSEPIRLGRGRIDKYYEDPTLDGLVPIEEGCVRARGYVKMSVKQKRSLIWCRS